jgi:hypothetical protein
MTRSRSELESLFIGWSSKKLKTLQYSIPPSALARTRIRKGAITAVLFDDHPTREIFDTMEYGPAPESDAEVREWIADKGPAFGHFIDGRFTKPARDLHLEEPRHRRNAGRGHPGHGEDVDAAVGAAAGAFPKWARRSGHERAKYLYALARLLQKHSRLFAVLESLDNGKPIREAATSTCHSRSGISTTTRASRNFLQKNFPVTPPSASAVRSSRGTSRS